jgi:hypothetical protein
MTKNYDVIGTRMTRIGANLHGFFFEFMLENQAKLPEIRANPPQSVSSMFPFALPLFCHVLGMNPNSETPNSNSSFNENERNGGSRG